MMEVDYPVKRFGAVTAVDGLTFTIRPAHVTGFTNAWPNSHRS
jgi:ABC-2 type transport system ATP-binding protein